MDSLLPVFHPLSIWTFTTEHSSLTTILLHYHLSVSIPTVLWYRMLLISIWTFQHNKSHSALCFNSSCSSPVRISKNRSHWISNFVFFIEINNTNRWFDVTMYTLQWTYQVSRTRLPYFGLAYLILDSLTLLYWLTSLHLVFYRILVAFFSWKMNTHNFSKNLASLSKLKLFSL